MTQKELKIAQGSRISALTMDPFVTSSASSETPMMHAASSAPSSLVGSSVHSWTDQISNDLLCNYFYYFSIAFAFWTGLSLLGAIGIFFFSKLSFGMLLAVMINILLSFGISATTALFAYLICDRALKPHAKQSSFFKKSAKAPTYEML